jgi:hypothetical protein
MVREPTEAEFLKDVSRHEMTVLRDDGLYRHIRLKRPDTGCMRFDLLTWPGYLAFTGDMGTFVFSRIADMFEFFRARPSAADRLPINLGYWHEKLDAIDRTDGSYKWSQERFEEQVRDALKQGEASEEVCAAAEEEVIRNPDGEYESMRAAIDFEHDGFKFQDFWETNCHAYTYRFIWCCYALVWGIRKYDAAKVPALSEGCSDV